MAEQTYINYVSPTTQGVDWTGLSDQLSTSLSTIEAERQAEREALDKMALDNTILVDSYVPGKSQNYQEFILRGANDAKEKISFWNKELKAGRLKPSDYKIKMNNLKEYWGTTANNAKNYDQRINDIVARQQEGKSGAVEAELLRKFTDATDIKNNALVVSDDGRVYTSKFDRATGQPTGEVADMRLLALPENIRADKIDLASQIENYIADWQPATMFAVDPDNPNVEIISESVKNQKDYELMKTKILNAISPDSNPRAQVSVLADNGALEVNFYYTDDEYNQKYEEALANLKAEKSALGEEVSQEDIDMIDLSLIKMGVDENNMYNPILTDEQRDAVKEFISNNIDIRTEDKITKEKSLEYQIETEQKRLTLAEQRARNAGKGKSKSSSTKDSDYTVKGVDQLRNMFNNFNSRAGVQVTRWLKPGFKLVYENNGTYSLYEQQKPEYNPNSQVDESTNTLVWKKILHTIKDIDYISDAIDKSNITSTIKGGMNLFGGELDN